MTEEEHKSGRKNATEKTALVTAVDYLARQAHSEKKLREKLPRKGFPQEEIDAAIERLIERKYLDDADLCDKELIRSAVPPDTAEREAAAAERVLAMKFKPTDKKQKMMANLYQKGFSVDTAHAAVRNFTEGAEA